MKNKLLIATNNAGKAAEFRLLLRDLPLELVTPAELGITTVVPETGDTFEANACLKAVALAEESRLITLADDSGLEVDALGGEPGVLSARYAGDKATDADRVNYLLSKLAGVPEDKRTAHFKCVIAIANPAGEVMVCDGECSGRIDLQPKGSLGFGYDPIFFIPALGKTMAELPPEIKNQMSHRARAARKVLRILKKRPFNLL